MRFVRLLVSTWFLAVALPAFADIGLLHLTFSPTLSVADGRSTVTVSAEVRDSAGRAARDGTQVVFSTTLGSFREEVVTSYGGFARAILIASNVPGVAKVTATAISMNATDMEEFEFVNDRAILSAAKEYIDLECPQTLSYNVDQRTLAAAAPHRGVTLKFRDVEIHADDVQVKVPMYEVRARNARVRIGKIEADFDEVYFALNKRRGFGTTTFTSDAPVLVPYFQFVRFEPSTRRRYGLAEIRSSGVSEPTDTFVPSQLEFADLSGATSLVLAKRAIAFPRKEIQFHHAEVFVAGAKILKVPLYVVSMSSSALVTEQILTVNNNQIAVNYPYYLSLQPSFTSLLRFTTGESYGRTATASRGEFLNYEMTWNHGDAMDGGLTVAGIGRNDWDLGVRQSFRPDDRTNAFLQGDLSQGSSLFGAASLSRSYTGYSAGFTGSSSHSLIGIPFSNDQATFSVEKDPMRIGKLPATLSIGLVATAQESTASTSSLSQEGAGLRARMQTSTQYLDKSTTWSANMTASSLVGQNTNGGFGVLANLTLTHQFGGTASAIAGYEFADDGLSSVLLGQHRVNLQMFYGAGRFNFTGVLERSIDIERSSYLFDTSFRFSNLWHVSGNYTLDSYMGQMFQDYYVVLAYRLGIRDVGLVYSGTTQRFGIQILGAVFN
jgi:hypothetical protein